MTAAIARLLSGAGDEGDGIVSQSSRRMTTSSMRMKLYWRTARSIYHAVLYLYTLVLIRCTVYDVMVPHVVDSDNGRGVYSRAVFISLSALEGAAFIRGRH